ncbi:cytochrome P450 [Trinickia sp. NRRL B-1857]|uniref:cytochrome P450 n=1 Tax=Trinickia sp. NRRL B-1857 TaxID=3162879 RepID=UPI003D276E51
MPTACDPPRRPPGVADVPRLTVDMLDADPHAVYRQYRRQFPFVEHEKGGVLVLRYADVARLGKDPRLVFTETAWPEKHGIATGAIFELCRMMFQNSREPHRRRREVFNTGFSPRAIDAWRPTIRKIADESIDRWHEGQQIELVEHFTSEVAARSTCELLGLPSGDRALLTRLACTVSEFFDVSVTQAQLPGIQAATEELVHYLAAVVKERRRTPRDDLISRFVAEDEADSSSAEQVGLQLVPPLLAGIDTMLKAGAIQVALLLQYPEQWHVVRRSPERIADAVTEALRYEPTVSSLWRTTTQDIELDGSTIPAGQFVELATMSAMRDESAYIAPDVFDIRQQRPVQSHPAFGYGRHRCVGEALVRTELEESLSALVTRLPGLRLVEAPRIHGHAGIRRIGPMKVAW